MQRVVKQMAVIIPAYMRHHGHQYHILYSTIAIVNQLIKGASKPGLADIQFYFHPVRSSVKLKVNVACNNGYEGDNL